METAKSSQQVLVCQTCGDKGYMNAFIYCVKCLGFVIHRYCLDVLPETSDELVSWFCDDCQPPLSDHCTSLEHDPSRSRKEDFPILSIVKTNHPKKKRKKKPMKKRKFLSLVEAGKDDERISVPNRINRCVVLGLEKPKDKSLQHVQTTKGKELPMKKRKVVPSPEKDKTCGSQETANSNCQYSVDTPSNSPPKEAFLNSDSGANQITPQSAELDNCCQVKGNVKRKLDTTEKEVEHSSCESSCTDATSKNEDVVTHTEDGLRCEFGSDNDKLDSNSSYSEKELNERIKEFNGNAYDSQSVYLENNTQDFRNQPAAPQRDPVWRGTFNITQTDYDPFEGFVGYLSYKACEKVREEVVTLPSMLSLEMDSRAHLWPESFLHAMPTGEQIALFFFPGDSKTERDFEQLVIDMIEGDLAMKATTTNAELLIFTSIVLPRSYWRFQGSYYLWGVFRRKKNDVPVSNHGDNDVSSANPASEVTSEKETLKRMESVESHSPQSPLCNYR
ncbi:hypothetical protein QVD17_09446 [Tagetes erecta]|uniref:AIPP2-like SPOC-like domain-containing protein n=1 Tax=Tagetes erecta TaxID=13708 RepID=A0AAD8L1H6_TARER|nr:hypothetical protein QVD17_09446 [Tagetes erecta]